MAGDLDPCHFFKLRAEFKRRSELPGSRSQWGLEGLGVGMCWPAEWYPGSPPQEENVPLPLYESGEMHWMLACLVGGQNGLGKKEYWLEWTGRACPHKKQAVSWAS